MIEEDGGEGSEDELCFPSEISELLMMMRRRMKMVAELNIKYKYKGSKGGSLVQEPLIWTCGSSRCGAATSGEGLKEP